MVFGFGDEHINRIIKDMLTIPSTHLVVISYSDIDSRIMNRINEFGEPSQISYIIRKNLADCQSAGQVHYCRIHQLIGFLFEWVKYCDEDSLIQMIEKPVMIFPVVMNFKSIVLRKPNYEMIIIMMTRIEYADSIRIGSVDFVSGEIIKVMLDIEAPHNFGFKYWISPSLSAYK